MWVLEAVDALGAHLDNDGIHPRDVDGLPGIVSAPFLHAGWGHLIGNTIPFLVLGFTIALGGLARTAAVTVIVVLVAGFGTWLIGPAHTNHIGASGVVFGFATYLVARGIFSRRPLHFVVGLLVLAIYGTTLAFALVPTPGISWQGTCSARSAAWSPPASSTLVSHLQQLRDRVPVAVGGRDAELRAAELLGELRAARPVRVEDVDLAAGELQLVGREVEGLELLHGVLVQLVGQERDVEVLRLLRHVERVRLDRGGELVARADHDLRVDAELLLDLLLELLLERGRLRAGVKTTLPLCTSVWTSV
jgi:hypothetical protein